MASGIALVYACVIKLKRIYAPFALAITASSGSHTLSAAHCGHLSLISCLRWVNAILNGVGVLLVLIATCCLHAMQRTVSALPAGRLMVNTRASAPSISIEK